MYSAQALVHGFPGKSNTHGHSMSSLWLLQKHDKRVLVDTAHSPTFPSSTAHSQMALAPDDITSSAYAPAMGSRREPDHVPNALIWVGEDELNWAGRQPRERRFSLTST